jgi:peroxiredoxin
MVVAKLLQRLSQRGAGSACRSRPRHVGILALFLALQTLAGCRIDGEPAAPAAPVGTEVGERAPALAGTPADGGHFELVPSRAAGTVVVFFRGYACGLCRERLRELQATLAAYEGLGARVVAATADAEPEVRRAVDELGLRFPVVSVDSATLHEWGALDTGRALPLPASYLVDNRGVIVFRHIGRHAGDRASDIELLAALRQARG